MEKESRKVVAKAFAARRMMFNEYRVSVLQDEKVSEIHCKQCKILNHTKLYTEK